MRPVTLEQLFAAVSTTIDRMSEFEKLQVRIALDTKLPTRKRVK
jgi:hypothetical protein